MKWYWAVVALGVLGQSASGEAQGVARPFAIKVVDEATGRGVPLIELRTVDEARYYTDSNGLVAFAEPGLMGRLVYFHVRGHGYEFPKDGFGFAGKALMTKEGGEEVLKVRRLNVAERLYRVTGGGIYRDTVLLGRKPATKEPVLNGLVFGSDSVVTTPYNGELLWFWGDTNRPGYPLGNFHVPGAGSKLPGSGGLDPEVGVDLAYEVDPQGFAKSTARMPGEGPTWIFGLVNVRDPKDGRERVIAAYVKVRNTMEAYEHGLCEYDPATRAFAKSAVFPEGAPIYPDGQPFEVAVGEDRYFYFAHGYPYTRVRADVDSYRDLARYEAYTPLRPGSKPEATELELDAEGRPVWAWKRNTPPLRPQDQQKLVRLGKLRPEDGLLALRDADTGKPVLGHASSVNWNPHLGRWVMIISEQFGTSMLGETWFAKAESPLGPWVYARKIVTHDKYSFYNPKQHPYFAKEEGRFIFFEGTYTATFSGNTNPTPRYDYNQIMYRLDVKDPRLNLPEPVREGGKVAFYAKPRPGTGLVAVYRKGDAWSLDTPGAGAKPAFHALPVEAKGPPATSVPLADASGRPLCRVWANPLRVEIPEAESGRPPSIERGR